MDQSAPQTQTTPVQTIDRTQAPQLAVTPGPSVTPVPTQISGPKEQERPIATSSVSEAPQDTEETPVKQEVGAPATPQQKEEQQVEIKAAMPEVAVEKSVEQVIEKSPDLDKPKISEQVKAAGVTHSGPGIPVQENSFAIHSMPMTFAQAAIIDKQTKLKDSRHWLSELVMYVWRKLDPTLGKKGENA